jgi:hypothetical protein
VSKEALDLLCELTRLFTLEAIHRSTTVCLSSSRQNSRIVELEGKPALTIHDLEMILPQLMLDF